MSHLSINFLKTYRNNLKPIDLKLKSYFYNNPYFYITFSQEIENTDPPIITQNLDNFVVIEGVSILEIFEKAINLGIHSKTKIRKDTGNTISWYIESINYTYPNVYGDYLYEVQLLTEEIITNRFIKFHTLDNQILLLPNYKENI